MRMLEVSQLCFAYGSAQVLRDVSLHVDPGEIVTLIGPNGAGKSTFLNVISGALRPKQGNLVLEGKDVTKAGQASMVRGGCLLVPEGRQIFSSLTVEDNLLLGGYVHRHQGTVEELHRTYDLFPRLSERKGQMAGTLSGGEQQMLAIGRAMMGRPKLMLLDEPSLGLSPQMVHHIFDALDQLRSAGLTILLVEQNAAAALKLADRGYLLQNGEILVEGTAEHLTSDARVRHVYLGSDSEDAVKP